MSSIGPQLPPQLLSKRRRSSYPDDIDDDDGENNNDDNNPPKHPRRDSLKNTDELARDASDSGSESDADIGPRPPPAAADPSPAAAPNADEIDLASSDSESHAGPSLPAPAASANKAPHSHPPASSSSSSLSDDDDDDFGPSLPSASAPRRVAGPAMPAPDEDNTPRRDAWMLAPPPSSTTFSERDTTRIRARKFASKPSAASNPAPAGPSIWTETPEEKLRRLQDSVLGRAEPGAGPAGAQDHAAEQRRRAREQRDRDIAERIDAQRGRSLYEEHQRGGAGRGREKGGDGNGEGKRGKRRQEEEEEVGEDDPSKRAFDREKDMALGGKIGAAQRRELIKKSANFGGRFSKGSFL